MFPGCVSLALPPQTSQSQNTNQSDTATNAPIFDPELILCGLTNCTLQAMQCVFDPECFDALLCHARCGSNALRTDQQACHLACQLAQGDNSVLYDNVIQCYGVNGCLPTIPPGTDGRCLVTDENRLKVYMLASLDELEGTWREVRGRNCGVVGSTWEGGYDALPCRTSSWVFSADQWWYHTSFCAPTGSCDEVQNLQHLIAEPRLSKTEPGLLEVPYANPPLQPQDEQWYVLAIPDPDWVMYTYCGSTPVGEYAGVNIMTRSNARTADEIPSDVEAAFRETAADFGFDYDEMCNTNHSQCPPPQTEANVQNWINAQ